MQSAASSSSHRIALAAVSLATLGLLMGCGGATTALTGPPQPLLITTQPADQTIPLGSAASFTVVAIGGGALSYQWSANGTPISGAAASTYTTPATITADNNATYTVTVRESAGSSLTSNPARLTIGPRSPKPGDLRFQQVDAPTLGPAQTLIDFDILIDVDHTKATFGQSTGSPLELAPAYYTCDPAELHNCTWDFWVNNQPATDANLLMTYTCDSYDALNTDLPSLSTPSSVVTSLDIPAGIDAFAVAVTSSTQPVFDMRQEVVSPGALASTVSTDGLHSRVITAVAFDATGQLHLLSYGWQADTTTLYDTTTTIVSASDIASNATNLAQNGYILTAFGGNEVNGYVLVGTKVQGDTLPRPLLIATQAQHTAYVDGYAPVGFVRYTDPAYPQSATNFTVLYEK